jgi:hypothetical protein
VYCFKESEEASRNSSQEAASQHHILRPNMPFPQWMRRFRSCVQSPPAYNLATSSQDIDIKAANPLITASDIPQWTWTKDQCIEWVTEILVEKCGHERADARRKAEVSMAEGGFGPTLYLRAATTWAKNLGKDDGHAIHALLLSYRHMKGAVPSGINIYQKPKEVGYSPPNSKKGVRLHILTFKCP